MKNKKVKKKKKKKKIQAKIMDEFYKYLVFFMNYNSFSKQANLTSKLFCC